MNQKIILINPYPKGSTGIDEATTYPPIGLAYIAAYLGDNGLADVEIIDANALRIDNERLIKIIGEKKPAIVGIHLNVMLGKSGVELSRLVKEELGIRVCIGGPLASSNPRETLLMSGADIAVIGEGEETFLEICLGKELGEIKGIAYIQKGNIRINPPREPIKNLDILPFPSYSLLPPLGLYKSRARRKPVGVILTSRGCPYGCTYCSSSVWGKTFRARSAENVIKEIDYLFKEYKIKQLDILDDNFTLDMARAEKILDLIISRKYGLLINLQAGVRADRLTPGIVSKMRQAGVFKTGIGIESGDPEIQKSINKSLNLQSVLNAIRWFRREGIITIGFFMIGFPEETHSSIQKTLNFAIRANPTMANFSMLIPFPGTLMHEQLKNSGLLKDEHLLFYDSSFHAKKAYHNCRYISDEELFRYLKLVYARFHLRPMKILDILLSIRSINELRWTLDIVLPLAKNLMIKNISQKG